MIVAKQKPIEEILEGVRGARRILVAGCNECVTVCEAGGKKEVAVLASLLRMSFMNQGLEVKIDEITLERQCDREYVEELRKLIDQYDVVLSLACGVGVQFLAETYLRTPVIPGLDTCFMGVTEQRGVWTERCQGCGQCILARTAGICPVSRCAKRLDCAWQLIINRLKELGRMEDYEVLLPVKDWSKERAGGPRKIVREDVR